MTIQEVGLFTVMKKNALEISGTNSNETNKKKGLIH